MASFADIRAKMNSKYGDSEEEKKKQQEQKRSTASATSASNFESIRSKMESTIYWTKAAKEQNAH